jgi:integrase
MTGNITRRGEHSWRIKYDLGGRDPATGKRLIRTTTVRGTKKAAQAELTRQLAALDAGTLGEPSKATLENYLRSWIDTAATLAVSPKTAERYRQHIEQQIVPHLGAHPLQKLRAQHVATWHATLIKAGGKDGRPLSPQTVLHAHRVLSKALADACRRELIARNPASIVAPPKVAAEEMTILSPDEVRSVLAALKDTPIYAEVVVLLSTGARRGEVAGLKWGDLDLDLGKLRIERSIEKTKAGLRVKTPKTRHGRRLISLPASAVTVLREHRRAALELAWRSGPGASRATPSSSGTSKAIRATQITFPGPGGDWRRLAISPASVCTRSATATPRRLSRRARIRSQCRGVSATGARS